MTKEKDISCCAATGWVELKRDRLDKTERPTLNRVDNKRTDRIPSSTWKNYKWAQHFADVMGRQFIRHTVI